jgi:Flp pilus assembly protein CpaB
MARTTSVSPDAFSTSNGHSSEAVDRPAGRAGRRRALPSGRAVGGGFVIAVAVVVTFAGWIDTHGGAATRWVVAAAALPAGTRLTAADLTTTKLRLGTGPAATAAFDAVGSLLGRDLAVAVSPGELILRSEVPVGPPAVLLRPVPVTVSPTDLVDLAVGDLVDVLETPSAGTTATTVAVVVRGARVLSTTQPSGGLLGSGGTEVVTLGVATLAEVTATVIAEHAGTLDVVVGEPSDGSGPGAGPS